MRQEQQGPGRRRLRRPPGRGGLGVKPRGAGHVQSTGTGIVRDCTGYDTGYLRLRDFQARKRIQLLRDIFRRAMQQAASTPAHGAGAANPDKNPSSTVDVMPDTSEADCDGATHAESQGVLDKDVEAWVDEAFPNCVAVARQWAAVAFKAPSGAESAGHGLRPSESDQPRVRAPRAPASAVRRAC